MQKQAPSLGRILVMVGFIGLILELKVPGMTVPGIIAAICFILVFWAQSRYEIGASIGYGVYHDGTIFSRHVGNIGMAAFAALVPPDALAAARLAGPGGPAQRHLGLEGMAMHPAILRRARPQMVGGVEVEALGDLQHRSHIAKQ